MGYLNEFINYLDIWLNQFCFLKFKIMKEKKDNIEDFLKASIKSMA